MARKLNPQNCRCPLSEEGCNWTGSLEDVTEHMSVCERSSGDVECPYKVIGCKQNRLMRGELDRHLKECQILHQQLLLKKMIGSNGQRRSVKMCGLESVWILLSVIVVLSVIVLGVFVQYQTQNDDKIGILKGELKSFKNNIEKKLQGMENTLKNLKNKIEIESQNKDNLLKDLKNKIEIEFQKKDILLKDLKNKIEIESQSKDNALLKLEGKIEKNVFDLRTLFNEKISALENKMRSAFERMYEKTESRSFQGVIMDILGYVFGSTTKHLIGMF